MERSKEIKAKIEEEIEKTDKLCEETFDKITSAFENQHKILNEKEEKMKKELDEKVEEIKNKFEKFLLESNEIISSCEKMIKSIEVNNGKYNNEIKTICYISEINKNNEKVNNFLKKPIVNLNISFPTESLFCGVNPPIYSIYYLNGIPVPKNINIRTNEDIAFIEWDIDKIKYKYKNVEYSVEIKDENNNNYSFISYQPYYLFKYKKNMNYEVKIRTIIDGLYGEYSEIKKFKLKESISFGINKDNQSENKINDYFGFKPKENKENDIFKCSLFDNNKDNKDENAKKESDNIFRPNAKSLFGLDKNEQSEKEKKDNNIFENDKKNIFGLKYDKLLEKENKNDSIFGSNTESLFGNKKFKPYENSKIDINIFESIFPKCSEIQFKQSKNESNDNKELKSYENIKDIEFENQSKIENIFTKNSAKLFSDKDDNFQKNSFEIKSCPLFDTNINNEVKKLFRDGDEVIKKLSLFDNHENCWNNKTNGIFSKDQKDN